MDPEIDKIGRSDYKIGIRYVDGELSVFWEETATSTTSDLGTHLNHWSLRSLSPPK